MRFLMSFGLVASVLSAAAPAGAGQIRGDYLEARTSDVWTGPCFANGEMNLAGKEAILAWSVTGGSWDGVRLDGLSVVGVVRSDATLGDPHRSAAWTRATILVDARADAAQRHALAAFARAMAEGLLDGAGPVRPVSIELVMDRESGKSHLAAGEEAEIRTRALGGHDMHCGNEEIYYEPLTPVVSRTPAYALVHEFRGDGLGATWKSNGKRSAFLARFER
jgi:hypothetical protein